jgi:hypothetical protein
MSDGAMRDDMSRGISALALSNSFKSREFRDHDIAFFTNYLAARSGKLSSCAVKAASSDAANTGWFDAGSATS